jgi:anti-sigma factor RsiW
MNPDKLFDYLDGKLPDHERKAVEERLMSDPTARREFDVARRIHASMRKTKVIGRKFSMSCRKKRPRVGVDWHGRWVSLSSCWWR